MHGEETYTTTERDLVFVQVKERRCKWGRERRAGLTDKEPYSLSRGCDKVTVRA